MRAGRHVHRYTARWAPRSGRFVVQICNELRPADARDRSIYEAAWIAKNGGKILCGETRVIFPELELAVRGTWPDRISAVTVQRAVREARRFERDRRIRA